MAVTKEERREAILDAATMSFSDFGYQNTDVQQIADRLKIGKGTIYRYFSTKKDLFFAAVDRAVDKLHTYILEKSKTAPNDESCPKIALLAYLEFFKEHPFFVELFVQERAAFRLRENPSYDAHMKRRTSEWLPLLQRLQTGGKLRYADPNKIIEVLTNMMYGIMFTRFFQSTFASTDFAHDCIDMILNGIFTKKSS
jgi:AcrR family transcriptional regulator